MHLLKDWVTICKKAWSVRFALLSALLGGIEIAVQFLAATRPTPYFAMAAAITSVLAAVSRIVAQPKAFQHDDE